MKPSSIVVETGDQAGIVIHLTVLAAIYTEAVEELDEFRRKSCLTSKNEVATAVARAAVSTAMRDPGVRIQSRLPITSEFPVTE